MTVIQLAELLDLIPDESDERIDVENVAYVLWLIALRPATSTVETP